MTLFLLSFGNTCHHASCVDQKHGSCVVVAAGSSVPTLSKWLVISSFGFKYVCVVKSVNTNLRKIYTITEESLY